MTDKFINNIRSIRKEDITPEVWHQARIALIDYISVTIAGANIFRKKELSYLDSINEIGDATIFGLNRKASMQTAALLNGMSAHVLELDDGHRIGMIHLGAPIISALLAVAEKENIPSEDLLYGIVIGYEVAIRLACAIQPSCKLNGYHATGVCGTVGATMAIGVALHFNFNQMKSAMSAAITSSSGLLEMIEGDTNLKPYNAGRAAMDAIASAYIGKAEFLAPEDALGGKRGFLNVFSCEVKMEYLIDFERKKFYIDTIYNKPYASCRHTHPSIEAAMQIRLQNGFKLEEVESIRVDTYKLAVNGHNHTEINGVNSAKMSIPYSLAVALVTGKAGLDEYSERYINDQQILKLTSKVVVKDLDELTKWCPIKRIASVEIKTKSGIFLSRVEYPKGEPENPLTAEEFKQKFFGLMTFAGYQDIISNQIFQTVNQPTFNIHTIVDMLTC